MRQAIFSSGQRRAARRRPTYTLDTRWPTVIVLRAG
jgi:hypothetical protein